MVECWKFGSPAVGDFGRPKREQLRKSTRAILRVHQQSILPRANANRLGSIAIGGEAHN